MASKKTEATNSIGIVVSRISTARLADSLSIPVWELLQLLHEAGIDANPQSRLDGDQQKRLFDYLCSKDAL